MDNLGKVELGINRFDFLLIVEFYRIMEYGVDPRLLGFQKKNEIKIQEDKQLDKFTYTGSKIKNQFTAYYWRRFEEPDRIIYERCCGLAGMKCQQRI